jgi:hypothetical protein
VNIILISKNFIVDDSRVSHGNKPWQSRIKKESRILNSDLKGQRWFSFEFTDTRRENRFMLGWIIFGGWRYFR